MLGRPNAISSTYPRVYRATPWLFALMFAGGAGMAIGGVIGAVYWATHSHRGPYLSAVAIASALLGVYCLMSTFRSRLVLFPDRIEIVGLTRTTNMSREEIRGYRWARGSLVLVPKGAGRRPVRITWVYRMDLEFSDWLSALPDLDTEEARASKIGFRNDRRLGTTPGERMRALAKGRRIAGVLGVATVIASFWGFLFPVPYRLIIVVLAVLPWLALEAVRRSGGALQIDKRRNDIRPTVVHPMLFPGLILLLRSLFDLNVLYSRGTVAVFVGIGCLFWLCVLAVGRATTARAVNPLGALIWLPFCAIYGYGLTIEANALLDRSPGVSYQAEVEGKRIPRGRYTEYELALAPWGPRTTPNTLRVSQATFDAIRKGDTVSLTLKRGALGASWYVMRAWHRGDQSQENLP